MGRSKGRLGGSDQGQSIIYGSTESYYLYDDLGNEHEGKLGDRYWAQWIEDTDNQSISFMLDSLKRSSLITLRRYRVRRKGEEIGAQYYWYGFKKQDKKLYKVYIGKDLTLDLMKGALLKIQDRINSDN